jgi:hypothetical protein
MPRPTDREIFEAIVALVKTRIPRFRIAYKSESVISKFLGTLVWPFNRRYLTHVTTTRFPVVYFPSKAYVENDYRRAWKVLAHEYVHLWDRYCYGPIFNVRYLSPQLLALLSVLFGPIALLALLPLPARGRTKIELRGYTMTMALNVWRYAFVSDHTKWWIAKQFTGPSYYFMWPFPADVLRDIDECERRVLSGELFHWNDPAPFRDVHEALTSMGVVADKVGFK